MPFPSATVSRRGSARWESGHPWIFKSDVVEFPDAPAGAVRVIDQRQKPLGVALWSPVSEIALRLLDRDAHAALDAAWWDARIGEAIERRAMLRGQTSAYRLVHGEGDALPSFVCDRYGEYLVVQFLSAGLEAFRGEIVASLVRLTGCSGILARNDAAVRTREGMERETCACCLVTCPSPSRNAGAGVRFCSSPPWTGRSQGLPDQRAKTERAGLELARGARQALDCLQLSWLPSRCTGQRHAQRVTALDSSAVRSSARGPMPAQRSQQHRVRPSNASSI